MSVDYRKWLNYDTNAEAHAVHLSQLVESQSDHVHDDVPLIPLRHRQRPHEHRVDVDEQEDYVTYLTNTYISPTSVVWRSGIVVSTLASINELIYVGPS